MSETPLDKEAAHESSSPSNKKNEPLLFQSANEAAKSILISWTKKVLYHTASTLLRSRTIAKHKEELQSKCQLLSTQQKLTPQYHCENTVDIHISNKDVEDAYEGTSRLAKEWIHQLELTNEVEAASVVRRLCNHGKFLEENENLIPFQNSDDEESNVDNDNFLSKNNQDIGNDGFDEGFQDNDGCIRATKETQPDMAHLNSEKEKSDNVNVTSLSMIGTLDPCNLSHKYKHNRTSSPSVSDQNLTSEWTPLPPHDTNNNDHNIHIPKATILPISHVKQNPPDQYYGQPAPTMEIVPTENVINTQHDDHIATLSLEERRKLWRKAQISKIDRLAQHVYTKMPNDELHRNGLDFHWFYGWGGIQEAAKKIPERMYMQAKKSSDYPPRKRNKVHYEVVPKFIAEDEERKQIGTDLQEVMENGIARNENDDETVKQSNAKISQKSSDPSSNNNYISDRDLGNIDNEHGSDKMKKRQSESEAVLANVPQLIYKLEKRRKLQESKARRAEKALLQSQGGEFMGRTLGVNHDSYNEMMVGREPSSIGEEKYEFQQIQCEIQNGQGSLSVDILEKELIHPTTQENDSPAEEESSLRQHILQGAMKPIGDIHTWEQGRVDISQKIDMDPKSFKTYQKERMRFSHIGQAKTLHDLSSDNTNRIKKNKTKIQRCMWKDGNEFIDLDLGECMMDFFGENGKKRILAFRSVEGRLLEYKP